MSAQCFFFFGAGSETAAVTAAYCLYELARNQDVQERLIDEIDSATEEEGDVTYKNVTGLVYLDQVVNESMRIYPPVPLITRKCIKDYRIPNSSHIIEKGTKIIIPIYGIHHDPIFYPDPERFDPDRFSPERKHSIIKYAFLPFGEGPRQCIGVRFGTLQVKMAVVSFLRQHRVHVCSQTKFDVSHSPSFIVAPIGPLKLLVTPRKRSTWG